MAQVTLSYLDHAKAYYGEDSSEYVNLRLAVMPISALYANHPAKLFGPAEFKTCRQCWLQDPKLTLQYFNKHAKRLLRVIKWAVSLSKLSQTKIFSLSPKVRQHATQRSLRESCAGATIPTCFVWGRMLLEKGAYPQ